MIICGMKPITAPTPATMPSMTKLCIQSATCALSSASPMMAPRPGIHRPNSAGSGSSSAKAASSSSLAPALLGGGHFLFPGADGLFVGLAARVQKAVAGDAVVGPVGDHAGAHGDGQPVHERHDHDEDGQTQNAVVTTRSIFCVRERPFADFFTVSATTSPMAS